MRLGLVLEGEDTLSWLQKLFAPGWIQELIDLNPEKSFERVVFISISQQREPHTKTVHPKSDRIQEIVAIKPEGPGPFKMDYTFETALPVFAFWLQSDGDGTGSEFKLSLKSFNYTIEELASQ